MALVTIAESIYAVESTLNPPGAELPLRCTVVRLVDGSLLMHSPVEFDKPTAQAVDALGKVSCIVAPSGFHYRFAAKAQARWGNAEVWASEAVQQKAPELRIAHVFGNADWPHSPEISAFRLHGAPKIAEVVFFHTPSQSLIVTDLVFNILEPKGLLAWLVFGLFGTYRHFDASRLYRQFISDRAAFAASLEPVLAQPFRRIIMAHGDVLEGDDLSQRLRAVTRRLC